MLELELIINMGWQEIFSISQYLTFVNVVVSQRPPHYFKTQKVQLCETTNQMMQSI
jgi:hypothetical protein